MSTSRLSAVRPGPTGVFLGSLAAQPAAVIRSVVAHMEDLGYGTLWYGESVGREAFGLGALLLSSTSRLVVASGIANIYARDPMAMANGARALQDAWPDRFILGLGVSHQPMVESRGHAYDRPLATMRAYLDKLEQAPWRGPSVSLPPIVLAALGPRMAELAAERTAGAYPYFTTAEHVQSMRAAIGPEPFIAADLPVVLAKSREQARRIGDAHTTRYLKTANYRNNLLRLDWPEEELNPPGSDRLFDAIVAWGDISTVRSRIEAMRAAGADQVVLNLITEDPSVPYVNELRELAQPTRA